MLLSRRILLVLACGALFPVGSHAETGDAYPTAALNWPGHKAQVFFSDATYVRFDFETGKVDEGYPQTVNDKTWPGLGAYAGKVIAGCDGQAGKAYLFLSDATYLRYDTKADKVEPGYPKAVDDTTWPGLGPYAALLSSAMNWKDNKIQFFLTDGRYVRYDVAEDRADAGYPQPVDDETWPGLAAYKGEMKAMLNVGNSKAFIFLKDGRLIRYDIPSDRIDPGYPK